MDKQIIIEDYFNIMRDDYGRIYCIQDIGDPKELIKAIREQNEYIQRKEQECENNKIAYKIELDIYNQECFNLQEELKETFEQLDQLKKQNDIMLNSLKKLQNKICSNTSQCKYFLMDVLKEVENASK